MLNSSTKKLRETAEDVSVNSRGQYIFFIRITPENTEDNCKEPNGHKPGVKIT